MDQSTLRSMRTRRRRRPTQTALVVVLLGALTASALVAGATTHSTFAEKRETVTALAALTGLDSHDQRRLDKAVRHLEKGLAEEFWADDGNSLAGKGEKVFKDDARAIRDLQKIEDAAVAAFVIDLLDIDRQLAQHAIDAAPADANTTKAEQSMLKAEEAFVAGHIDKAVSAYGKAWKHAVRAQKKVSKAGSSSDGKYSVYDVVFVRTGTDGTNPSDVLEVSGSNKPNLEDDTEKSGYTGKSTEGYLFSPDFLPEDTFLDPGLWPGVGVMQLHVSCSVVFPGGFGAKSDPAATSQWRVNSIHIVKYKDGVIEKECDVVGAGLSLTPSYPEQ